MAEFDAAESLDVLRIPINWSDATVAELRQVAEGTLSGRHPIESTLAPALLLASEGQWEKAEALVLGMMAQHAEGDRLSDPLFLPFLLAAVCVQRFDIAGEMLRKRWKLDCVVEIRVGVPSGGFACVRWEILTPKLVRFTFDKSIYGRDNPRNRLLSFVWLFPLFAAYVAGGPEEMGAVDVSLWDTGLSPGLAFCSNRPDHFLIPDNLYISSRAYEHVQRAYREHVVAWDQREGMAFWRGTTTGHPLVREVGWRSLPRIRLCELAQQHSDLIDAGISAVTQIADQEAESAIRAAGLMRAFVPAANFNRYRYHIDIDGNTNSWPGLFQKLCTCSPVLKIASASGHRQWYYHRLMPWVNFVPISADMSDLVEKIRWLRAHDDVARAIGEQGQALAFSMGFDNELSHARRIITAALRYFADRSEYSLQFGLQRAGNAQLEDGWSELVDDGAVALGCESRLRLPRPIASGDFVLSLEVSPVTEPTARLPQRVTIGVNGQILRNVIVTERQVLACPLPRSAIGNEEIMLVTLLYPDAHTAASEGHPLDNRRISIVLHEATLTSLRAYVARPVSAPSTHTNGTASAWTLSWPAGLGARRLLTNHGTVVFIDPINAQLRHGLLAFSPANVVITSSDLVACLTYLDFEGKQHHIRVPPTVDSSVDAADEFRVEAGIGASFGLSHHGVFLCAEPDGQVTLSRQRLGPWEQFQVVDP